jgi:hypothetical protein
MRTQIWIIATAFIIFGIVAWIVTSWSPSYLGLIFIGGVMFLLGWLSTK